MCQGTQLGCVVGLQRERHTALIALPHFLPTGATTVPALFFWVFSGLLLIVDTTGKPSCITRYRIQLGKNEPVSAAAAIPAQSKKKKLLWGCSLQGAVQPLLLGAHLINSAFPNSQSHVAGGWLQ